MPTIESILDRQVRKWELERTTRLHEGGPHDRTRRLCQPVLTVSRQRGSGGTILAERLAQRFGYTLLHRDIIDRIVESAGYKRRIVESLDGHARSQLQLWFESVVQGAYVDAGDYVKALLEVIYSISELGGVVVVGRGANFILGHDRGFHIRVVAPREVRVRNLVTREGMSEHDARREIERADHERDRLGAPGVRPLGRRPAGLRPGRQPPLDLDGVGDQPGGRGRAGEVRAAAAGRGARAAGGGHALGRNRRWWPPRGR